MPNHRNGARAETVPRCQGQVYKVQAQHHDDEKITSQQNRTAPDNRPGPFFF